MCIYLSRGLGAGSERLPSWENLPARKAPEDQKWQKHGGPRLAPDVPPYQCFREGPGGNTAKKDVKKSTFEAGMCMKTNKSRTKCPEKSRTFMSKIRTFASNRHEFCRNSGEFTVKRRHFLTQSLAAGKVRCRVPGVRCQGCVLDKISGPQHPRPRTQPQSPGPRTQKARSLSHDVYENTRT